MSRYRFRAFARRHLPDGLIRLVPKGRDCGDHEWQLMEVDGSGGRWACVYCQAETDRSPWGSQEYARRRLAGLFAEADGLSDNDLTPAVLARYRVILGEAHELLSIVESDSVDDAMDDVPAGTLMRELEDSISAVRRRVA